MANSHKRETNARKSHLGRFAAPVAITASVIAIGVGMGTATTTLADPGPEPTTFVLPSKTALDARIDAVEDREAAVSRSSVRVSPVDALMSNTSKAVEKAVAKAGSTRWTTATMRRWTRPDNKAVQKGTMAEGAKVKVTGRSFRDRVEVVQDGRAWWITAGYLTDEAPVVATAGLSMKPCPNPSVESGLTQSAIYVYRSVCNAFPQITSYGGWDNHGEHVTGKAIDIMTSDVELGTAIAEFLRSHSAELNLYDVIWRQHIFMPMRAADGWRPMASRGSITANHYDHVHVAVN